MQTKLSLYCEKVIEAGWLAAVVVTPMLFNVYTEGVFEVNKVSLVRSIALVMSLAWLIRAVEGSEGWPWQERQGGVWQTMRDLLSKPLVLPVLAFTAVQLLTTLTSVWRHGSFWGAYDRRQGTYVTLSYIAIFFMMVDALRTKRQMERLVALVVFASLPVSLYALIQHFDLLPGPWGAFSRGRVLSSLQNPIFAAAYLIMIVPLTVRQLLRALSTVRAGRGRLASGLFSAGFYLLVLVAQLAAIVLTQSRGPFLGLLGGLFFFFLVWALTQGHRKLALLVIALALLVGVLFVVLNLPNTPLAAVKEWPYVGRLGDFAQDRTLQSRSLIWQGVVDMSTAGPLRAIVGYGPESMDLAFYGFIPPELVEMEGPKKTADRAHNRIMDALATSGLLGVVAYLAVYSGLIYHALRGLGFVSDASERRLFAGLLAEGGVLGFLAPWVATGTLRFAGPGIAAGLVGGLVVYLILFMLRRRQRAEGGGSQMLLIALLSALMAHFVESQTGIDVTTTRLVFWVYAAIVAALALAGRGRRDLAPAGEDVEPSQGSGDPAAPVGDPRRASILGHGLIVGLLLITIAHGFVTHQFGLQAILPILVLCALVWILGGAIAVAEARAGMSREGADRGWMGLLLVHMLAAGACLVVFLPIQFAVLGRFPAVAALAAAYYVCFFIILLLAGAALLGRRSLPDSSWRRGNWWLYPILSVLAVVLVGRTNLNVVRADIYSGLGRVYQGANRWDSSIGLYEWAVHLAPKQDHYYRFLGFAYLNKAGRKTPGRSDWFEKAEEAYKRAVEISPLNPDHQGNLGNLYHARASVTDDPAEKAEALTLAMSYYQQAVRLAPQTHGRLLQDAMFEARLSLADSYVKLGNVAQAIQQARAAAALAPAEKKADLEEFIAQLEDREG